MRLLRIALLSCALAAGITSAVAGIELLPEWAQGVAQIVFGITLTLWALDRLISDDKRQRSGES